MSLYDDASLIAYPSGYKESKIHAQKPVSGAGDLTFSRASSATRVNAEGLIETAAIIGSELVVNGEFATDTDWVTPTGWDIIGGNAVSSSGNGSLTQNVNVTASKTYEVTINLTSYTSGTLFIDIGGSAAQSTITLGSQTFTFETASTGLLRFYGGAFRGSIDNVSVKEYTTSNIPRIDYSNGCGSLLLEPQRTNLVTYSEDFSNAAWQVFRGSVSASTTISPEGIYNAYRYEENADNGQHFLRTQSIAMSSGLQYTASVFVKAAELTSVSVGSNNNSIWSAFATFNLSTGLVTAGSGTIEHIGSNWYRCIVVGLCSTTST